MTTALAVGMKTKLGTLVLALATVLACGKSGGEAGNNNAASTTTAAPTAATTEAPKPSAAPSEAPKAAQHVELQLASVANTMAYDKTALSVPTGAEVHLTLKNNATMSTLPHNWVLVKPGTEAAVAAAGLKMGETAGYIDVRDKDILVNSPFAKPGETAELTFTAPEPGKYPYICTVPGHYLMMKGVLTVTP
jgi:azurin